MHRVRCAPRKETYDYNNRLQPVRAQLGTEADPDALACWVYNYYTGTAPTSCDTPTQAASGNNGSVVSYLFQDNTTTPSPDMDHSGTLTYDNVNRLPNSTASGTQSHNLNFGYDRFGNATCTGGTGLCTQLSFDGNNRITGTGYTYDAAGNLTQDGSTSYCTYTWDGEGRLSSISGCATLTFTYNALGQRAEKQGASYYRESVYDGLGQLIGIHKRDAWLADWFWVQGRVFAKYESTITKFLHPNPLGSTGGVTDHTGAVIIKMLYYPCSQRWQSGGAVHDERFAALGQRDAESAQDPTLFRMYHSRLNRRVGPGLSTSCVLPPFPSRGA